MNIYAGTSGYSYKEWKGVFYPEDLPNSEMLNYYGQHLPSVEINNTFYRFPNASMIETWSKAVPEGFRFSLKASQKITHVKRLRDANEEASYLMETVRPLGKKLGVILFQCPPYFRKDTPRLREFLAILPRDIRSAFEFRHTSWFDEEVYEALRSKNCALCVADTDEELKVPFVSTATWGYIRLRRAEYSKQALRQWMKKLSVQKWEDAFVFFKHEDEGAGAKLAMEFLALAEGGKKRVQSKKRKR